MDGPTALNEAMEQRRKAPGVRKRWNAVAVDAGMTVQHLLRIRSGSVPLTEFAAAGIDSALGWPDGEAWRIYQDAGGRPGDEPPFELADDTERRIWALGTIPADERVALIEQHRDDKQRAVG